MNLDELFGQVANAEDAMRREVPELFSLDGQKVVREYVVLASLDSTELDFARALCEKYKGRSGGQLSHKPEGTFRTEFAHAFLLPPENAETFRQEVFTIVDVYRNKITFDQISALKL